MPSMRKTWMGGLLVALVALLAGCSGGGTRSPAARSVVSTPAAPSQAASPAPTTAPLSLQGKFSLSPAHGPWDTSVTASATGLLANTKYDIVWTTVTGSWKLANQNTEYQGRQYAPTEKPLTSATTDGQGSFQTTFVVPEEFGFQHDVLVKQAEKIVNKSGFDVDMQVSISPTSGPVGTPITIEAKGIGWRQMENSWLVSYDNQFTGWISAVTTNGYAKAVIPATGGPGVHVITVLHGDFTFPYLNMQQSPEPSRPQFHIPFTVTGGPAVLPPALAAQVLTVRQQGQPPGDGSGVWVDPPEATVGSRVAVKARGLPVNTALDVTWSTVVGNRVSGNGWDEQVKTIATVNTDAAGDLNWTLLVPDDLGGAHTVGLKAGDRTVATGVFTIQPSAQELSVSRGPSGTEIMIQLNGVGWTETANIYNVVYDNGYVGYACGFNSNGNVQIFMRASGAPGWHFIDLYPGIYKGQETRPLNFRVPQLTYADDHPGERLPAFRFAFYVTPD